MSRWSRRFWFDLLERVGSTFLAALLPVLVAAGQFKGFDALDAVATAGFAALLSLIKGLLANMADAESGASLLPSPPGPEVLPDAHDDGPARWNDRGAVDVVTVLVVAVLVILVLVLVGVLR